jgi:hypothetical protein
MRIRSPRRPGAVAVESVLLWAVAVPAGGALFALGVRGIVALVRFALDLLAGPVI